MPTIVCFGDSNTWGCPPFANIAQTPDRIVPARRWANVMGRELGPDSWVVEEGLSGRTTVFDDPIEGIHKNGSLTLIQMIKGHFAMVEHPPEVLVVTPPSITEEAEPAIWGIGHQRCRDHAHYLEQVAHRTGCFHFDANKVVRAGIDGIHMDEASHEILGKALAGEVRAILAMRNLR